MHSVIRTWSLVILATLCMPALAADAWDELRHGGVVVVMRHAITEPGTGDPPGFRADDCTTQRNLSVQGRAQAERMGALFASRGVVPFAVFSSARCRCIDTGKLAFPSIKVAHLPALDSVFSDNSRASGQTAALLNALQRIPQTPQAGITVWVTHQANIAALTGEYVGMGEALVLRTDGAGKFSVRGRLGPPAN